MTSLGASDDIALLFIFQMTQTSILKKNFNFDNLLIMGRSGGSRIFPRGGAPTPKIAIIFQIFAENCMKMKEFGSRGLRVPGTPPWICQWVELPEVIQLKKMSKVEMFLKRCKLVR